MFLVGVLNYHSDGGVMESIAQHKPRVVHGHPRKLEEQCFAVEPEAYALVHGSTKIRWITQKCEHETEDIPVAVDEYAAFCILNDRVATAKHGT
jgi:hypothetical protein